MLRQKVSHSTSENARPTPLTTGGSGCLQVPKQHGTASTSATKSLQYGWAVAVLSTLEVLSVAC